MINKMTLFNQREGFYRDALLLMLPLILQNFVVQFMFLADNFMVGALGETELAAVTSANSLFFVLGLICFGVQSGVSVLVAQYSGRGGKDAINRVLGMGLYVSMALTGTVAVLSFLFPDAIMGVLTNNSELWEPGADYARIVGFSFIFNSISGTYVAVQRSMERPRLGAIVFSLSGALNVLLNYMFIFGKLGAPAMGCAGAALATVLSRAFEVLFVAVYAARDRLLPLHFDAILRPGGIIVRDFFKYSLPVVMNEGLWSMGISLYAVILGHMEGSTPILAAYTVASNLDKVMTVGLFAAGSATAIIIGRDIVRLDRETARSEAAALNVLCVVIGAAGSVITLLTRAYLCDDYIFPIMSLSAAAREIARYFLLVLACMTPLRAISLCNVVGVFRGGGDVHYALVTDVTPMYLITIPAAAVAALVLKLDITVVYVIMCMDDIFKVLLALPRLRSGKWINNVTREEYV